MTVILRQRLALAAVALAALAAPAAAHAASTPPTHRQAARDHARPTRLEGVVRSVDAGAGTLVVGVSGGAGRGVRTLVGSDVTVSLGAHATVHVAGAGAGATLADVSAGDRVLLLTSGPVEALVAESLVDRGAKPSPTASGPGAPSSSPPSTPAPPTPPAPPTSPTPPSTPAPAPAPAAPAAVYWAFNGTVTSVGSNTLGVAVTQAFTAPSTYVGRTQQFSVSSGTRFKVADNNGDGTKSLADVSVGDAVSVYVLAPNPLPALGSVLSALEVVDSATASTSGAGSTTSTPAPA